MISRRVTDHPILGPVPERGKWVDFTFNGQAVQGYEGEPIAAALLAAGIRILRHHEVSGEPRGLYCGIGHCFECRVTVNGEPNLRSCITPVRAGIAVESVASAPADIPVPQGWNGGEGGE